MQKRIFRGALLLTLATALVIGLLSAAVYYHRSGEQLESQLWQELDMLSTLMEQSADQDAEEAALKALNMPNRLTWIAPDGTVRYDNQSNAASMENHLGREEIAQASETGTGFSKRFSQTLLEEQLYCAQKLWDGSYLRLSATQSSLAGSLWRMGWALAAGIAAVLIVAAVLSRIWTRSLVRPINEINLENPLENRVYDELSPMLRRMAEQNRRLDMQMREIAARRGELETIIGHMNEGLLILDAHRHVLLMNDSARAILHTDLPADGKNAAFPLQPVADAAGHGGKGHCGGRRTCGHERGRARIPAHGQHGAPQRGTGAAVAGRDRAQRLRGGAQALHRQCEP